MGTRFFIFLLICLASFHAKSASELSVEEATQRLQLDSVQAPQGHFIQRKYFAVLKQPFITKGHYQLGADSFLWQTTTPVQQRITLQDGKLFLSQADGTLQQQNQALPYVQLIQYLLRGDLAALANSFTFTASDDDCLILTPSSDDISALFSHFTVCGSGQVHSVTLVDTQRNKTEITLTPSQETGP